MVIVIAPNVYNSTHELCFGKAIMFVGEKLNQHSYVS